MICIGYVYSIVRLCYVHWDSWKSFCLNNFCSFSAGLCLNILQTFWSRRFWTPLQISRLKKSQSRDLLFFESRRYTFNILYGLSVIYCFYLMKTWIQHKPMSDSHWRTLRLGFGSFGIGLETGTVISLIPVILYICNMFTLQ